MQIAIVTAEIGEAAYAHIAVGQIIFCELQPGIYNVLLTGAGKKLFVKMLKIGKAQAKRIRELWNSPGIGRIIVYLCAQPGEILIIFLNRSSFEVPVQFLLQHIQENVHKGIHNFFFMNGGAVKDIRQHPHIFRQLVKVMRLNKLTQGKLQSFKKILILLVRDKMNPVIVISNHITAIMYVSVGRKAYERVGGNLDSLFI